MKNYLVDCEIMKIGLRIPKEHIASLLDYFDGWHEGERGIARALVQGNELRFESRGGRFTLELEGNYFLPRDIDIFDDRGGEFFEKVILNLFIAYHGTLRCIVKQANPRTGKQDSGLEISVQDNECSVNTSDISVGGWLTAKPETNLEAEAIETVDPYLEEIFAKIDEAKRYFAEYLRLRATRAD